MSTQIEITDLPARLDEALSLARQGQEIVIVSNGEARATLLPLQPKPDSAHKPPDLPPVGQIVVPPEGRTPNLRPGAITLLPNFDDPLPEEFWMGDE